MPRAPDNFKSKEWAIYEHIICKLAYCYCVTRERVLQDPKRFGERMKKDLERLRQYEDEEYNDDDYNEIE